MQTLGGKQKQRKRRTKRPGGSCKRCPGRNASVDVRQQANDVVKRVHSHLSSLEAVRILEVVRGVFQTSELRVAHGSQAVESEADCVAPFAPGAAVGRRRSAAGQCSCTSHLTGFFEARPAVSVAGRAGPARFSQGRPAVQMCRESRCQGRADFRRPATLPAAAPRERGGEHLRPPRDRSASQRFQGRRRRQIAPPAFCSPRLPKTAQNGTRQSPPGSSGAPHE